MQNSRFEQTAVLDSALLYSDNQGEKGRPHPLSPGFDDAITLRLVLQVSFIVASTAVCKNNLLLGRITNPGDNFQQEELI